MSGKRILLVEDNEENSRLATKILRHAGYEVILAETADAALAAVRQTEFGLVLLDISLPEKDGWEVLEDLRGRGDATPVVMLSAHVLPEYRERARESGANDFLTKPFRRQELLGLIGRLLNE